MAAGREDVAQLPGKQAQGAGGGGSNDGAKEAASHHESASN
jgi:hypothetical protein